MMRGSLAQLVVLVLGTATSAYAVDTTQMPTPELQKSATWV